MSSRPGCRMTRRRSLSRAEERPPPLQRSVASVSSVANLVEGFGHGGLRGLPKLLVQRRIFLAVGAHLHEPDATSWFSQQRVQLVRILHLVVRKVVSGGELSEVDPVRCAEQRLE